MKIFGWYFAYDEATDVSEAKLWSNTNHGNRHQRIFSLERVISERHEVAYGLYIGKHRLQWAKLDQSKYFAKANIR